MSDPQKEQVRKNYDAFVAVLPSLLPTRRGKFALMRDGAIIEFFDTAGDAFLAGKKLFSSDMLFSVQEVTDTPVDLGFFSHAMPQRKV